MRSLDYFSIALKDLGRQFLRSLLTIIALCISTVIVVTLAALSLGGQQALVDQFGSDEALRIITVTPNQNSSGLSLFGSVQQVNDKAAKLTDQTAADLAKLPHVQASVPRAHLWELSSFSVEGVSKQFVATTEGLPADAKLPLKTGTLFTPDSDNAVILGYGYAKELGYGDHPEQLVGRKITFTTQKGYRGDGADIPPVTASRQANEDFNQHTTTLTATITGIGDTGPDQNSLFVPLAWARDIRTASYNTPEGPKHVDQLNETGYTTIQLSVDDAANVAAVSSAVSSLGFGQFSTLAQIQRLQQLTTILWVILGAVALVAAVAAALGVTNTMLMAVSEQRYTIGVWRAVGARRSMIVRMFLIQAGVLGCIGGAIGTALGILISQYVNQHINTLLAAQGLSVTNIAFIPPWLAGAAVLMTTAFGILAGMYPAYRAARVDPSEALRSN